MTPDKVSYRVLGSANTPNHRVRVTVSNVRALMFMPYNARNLTLPPIWCEFPARRMGAGNQAGARDNPTRSDPVNRAVAPLG